MQATLLQCIKRSAVVRNRVVISRQFSSSVSTIRPFQVSKRYNSTKAQENGAAAEKGEAEKVEAEKGEAEQKSQGKEQKIDADDAVGAAAETEKEPAIIAELREKLEKKDKDLAAMRNHYTQAKADFRHLQETTKIEKQKAKDFALQKFAKELLESLDNFDLALGHVKAETLKSNEEVKNLYDGVDMTRNIFEKTLAKFGVSKIEPLDQPFDPNLHEATFEVSHPDKVPGTVFFVQQNGYTLNDRVLRPAKVGVVKVEE
ncbi:mge1 [Candida oxycetoniae]|uniref:GrpE protein homolog n=1 Tax=Candida oxycetoniae TaxID=497107 RepID=A0AAI9SWI8_9ASCO|nr:mge1 [Candida oxycetoniae]KAI3404045.2 mge1 [Candida oxycetoniae]